jgi:hypothetical protein
MAGIYNKTFKKRPTIALAPDAIVRINGSVEVMICPSCRGTIFLSEYITSISTSLATNGTVGTANFSVSMPRHGHESKYMIRKGRLYGLSLMDEVEIFIKGRFQKGNGDSNKYYKVFWGLITNIQESYSDGFLNLGISCESILKWLQLMKTNEHPAAVSYTNSETRVADFATAAWSSKSFANLNPYEIIVTLMKATYRNIVLPDALDTERLNLSAGAGSFDPPVFFPEDIALMEYWNKRFEKLTNSLKIFGVRKEDIKEIQDTATASIGSDSSQKPSVATNNLTPFRVLYDSSKLADFRPYFKREDASSKTNYSANSYKSNLEIINEVKLFTGFEFYLDTNGDIVFKPPFWNLDTKRNAVFVLKDNDILSYDFSEDANQIVTRLDVTGSIFYDVSVNSDLVPRATFTDWNLARQHGIKEEVIAAKFLTNKEMCFFHAISEMDRINANRYSGTVTILGRPEVRLGYPIYIESRDIFGYVDNISHNFTFGGTFTTQIEISAIRKRYKLPNRILVATDKNNSIEAFPSLKEAKQSNYVLKSSSNLYRAASRNYKTNRSTAYEEIDSFSSEGLKIINSLNESKKKGDTEVYLSVLENYIPVSDGEGYELIGNYENGKRFYLTPNYKLETKKILNDNKKEELNNPNKPEEKRSSGSIYDSQIPFKDTADFFKSNPQVANDFSNINPDSNSTPLIPDETNTLGDDIISDFSKTSAFFASQLSPKNDGGKGCSCSNPVNSFKIKNQNNKKTMGDFSKR